MTLKRIGKFAMSLFPRFKTSSLLSSKDKVAIFAKILLGVIVPNVYVKSGHYLHRGEHTSITTAIDRFSDDLEKLLLLLKFLAF